MTKRKKITIILVVSLVTLLLISGGGLWWFYQNSGGRLLQKAELAIKAGNYDKAIALAGKYIDSRPQQWIGYYTQANAYKAAGKYDQARQALEKAAAKDPNQASVPLLMAETYFAPARQNVTSRDLNTFREGVNQYAAAAKLLAEAKSQDEKAQLDLMQSRGLVLAEMGPPLEALARMLDDQAKALQDDKARLETERKTAEARRETEKAKDLARQAKEADDKSKDLSDQAKVARANSADAPKAACAVLLEVVTKDPARDEAAKVLIQLCVNLHDEQSLAAARQAVMSLPDPAPVAMTMLTMQDLRSSQIQAGLGPVNRAKLTAACQVLDQILQKHPDSAEVMYTRASLAAQLADYQPAQSLCERVLGKNPKHYMARLLSGQILSAQGDSAGAEKAFAALTAEVPQWAEAQYAFAKTSIALGKTTQAINAMAALAKCESRQTDPAARQTENLSTKLMLSELALALSDAANAKRLAEEVVKVAPGNPSARLMLGIAQGAGGYLPQAQKTLSDLAKDCPQWPVALLAYARAALQNGDQAAAISAAAEAAKLDPENAEAAKLLTQLNMQQDTKDNYKAALEQAQATYQAHADDPAALTLLIEVDVKANKADLARATLEKAAADAKTPELLMAAADGYAMLADTAAAQRLARQALACTPSSVSQRSAVARALIALDRLPEAEKLLNDELAKDPNQAALHYQLGQLCAATGRMLPAIDQLRAAADLQKDNVDYQLALAQALLDSGDIRECRKVLDSMDSANARAAALRLRVKLIQGEAVSLADLAQGQSGQRSALSMALPYLAGGQIDQCIRFCQAELAKTPDDLDLRMVLGRAFIAKGDEEHGIEEWQKVLEKSPQRLSTYLELASVLSRSGGVDQAGQRMAKVAGASQDMIDLSLGAVLLSSGSNERGQQVLSDLAKRPNVPDHIRGRAILLSAQALSTAGQADKALALCEKLSALPGWKKAAADARAQLFCKAGPADQAAAAINDLRQMALADNDTALLRQVIELFTRIGKIAQASAACDQLEKLQPDDSRTQLIRAAVLDAEGKPAEAINCYRKAVELQPRNFSLPLLLARALDAQQRQVEALEVLRKMEESGPAAAAVALFQRGQLFASWGLQEQAVACFNRLAGQGYSGGSQIQLALGSSLAQLGQAQKAAEALNNIPPFAAEYVQARLLLAAMAPNTDARLAVLKQLDQAKPGRPDVLLQQMTVLVSANRPADALKEYDDFVANHAKTRLPPEEPSFLAVLAMLETGKAGPAGDLAVRFAKETGLARWRNVAVLLKMDSDPQAAAGLLPEPAAAELPDAMLGFCLACQRKDQAAQGKWFDQFAKLTGQLAKRDPALAAYHGLLVCAAVGQPDQAKAQLDAVGGVMGFGRKPAAELVALSGPAQQAQALGLLKATLALNLGLPRLGNSWAIGVLKSNPACQWAAAIAARSDPDPKAQKAVLDALSAKDGAVGLILSAEAAARDRDFAKAAQLFAKVAADDAQPDILIKQGLNLEYSGKQAEALAVYEQVLAKAKSPDAANNAAYVMTQLYAKDPGKLADAAKLVEEAVKLRPENPSYRDTLGWILYLQGKPEDACAQLRKAVRGSAGSPAVHYHLAMAESACGRMDLARWHHAAVASLAKAMSAKNAALPAEVTSVVELAARALDALGPER